MAEFQTSLDIANTACQLLGVPRITSFTEDSKAASAMLFAYDKLRRAELQRNVWRSAVRVAVLRAIDSTVMQLVPAAWSASATYPVGSIISYSNQVYQALQAVPANQEPDTTPYWEVYFGSMTVTQWAASNSSVGVSTSVPAWSPTVIYQTAALVSYNGVVYQALTPVPVNQTPGASPYWVQFSVTSTPVVGGGYYAGELVYVLTGTTPVVYMSMITGNTDNPADVAPWSATTIYNAGDTAFLTGNGMTYQGTPVLYRGAGVLTQTGLYQSTQDLNIGNTPGLTAEWELVPPAEAEMMSGQNWLRINASIQSIRFVYPIGSGPGTQTTSRNVFQLPNGYLKEAPQDPKAGAISFLGSPSNPAYSDWEFQGNYITSRDTPLIILRFSADVTVVSSMTSMFCNGLACRLAEQTCEELTQSTAKKSAAQSEYKVFMGEARMSNAIEEGADELPLDDYIACRI